MLILSSQPRFSVSVLRHSLTAFSLGLVSDTPIPDFISCLQFREIYENLY